MTVEETTRDYVISVLDEVPHRSGDLNLVTARGKRRRTAQISAKAAGLLLAAALAVVPFVLQRPSPNDVAAGGASTLRLPGGFVVPVEPGELVESRGALVFLGALADVARFDTSRLGAEVAIVRNEASELVVPLADSPLEANALRASRLVYIGDRGVAQLALQVTDDGQLCMFFGNGTDIAGAGYCPVTPAPIVGSYSDPALESWLVWSWLPEGTAIVQVVLPDGSTFWQQPVARTAFFYVEGTDLSGAAVRGFDSEGNLIIAASADAYPEADTSPNP